MKKFNFTKIARTSTLTALLFSGSLFASPFVDKELTDFVRSPSIRSVNEQIATIVVFKAPKLNLYRPSSSENHATIERALIRQNEMQIQNLAKALKTDSRAFFNLWSANAAIVDLSREDLKVLTESSSIDALHWAKRPLHIEKSKEVYASAPLFNFTEGLTTIGIPKLHEKYPDLTGKGVRVGILDTGLTPEHKDLTGRLLLFKNFSPDKSDAPSDGYNHGTHVCGTIAGGNSSGIAIGVAPDARLNMAKIFDADGMSNHEDILKALQWVADPDGNPDTNDFSQVVNNSWGNSSPFNDRDPQDEPMCKIVDSWVKLGIVPVFSAGNSGPGESTVGLPAGCPNSFAVGATDFNDNIADFSSIGPAVWKSNTNMKPEISAPGVDVYSSINSLGYGRLSGTSMAAPHVTGAFAILFQADPHLTVERAESLLTQTSKDLGPTGRDNTYGHGRLDIFSAIEALKAKANSN